MTRINTNVSSLNAQKTLAKNQASLNTSMTRLSTGLKINSGADDPSGMIAAAIQSNDIASMNQAITNTQNGTMLINTADSALGQITNLLTDIRGLVTQVGNTAVVNSDMIAANQLQVNSALQAIDRISQVTKFQGQKILDGTLDFLNTAQNIPQVTNLSVTQANLGATGQLGVSVQVAAHATQADITTSSGQQQATATLAFSSRASLAITAGGGAANLEIVANSNSTDYNGVKINMTIAGAGTAASAVYDQASKTLTLTGDNTQTSANYVTAINNTGLFTGYASAAGAVTVVPGTTTTTAQAQLQLTAVNKGADYNNVQVVVNSKAGQGAATPAVNWNAAAKTLTVTLDSTATYAGGTSLTTIQNAINNDATVKQYFTASGAQGADKAWGSLASDTAATANTSETGYLHSSFSADTKATGTITLAQGADTAVWTGKNVTYTFGGAAADTGALEIKATQPGSKYDGMTVAFAATGALGAVYTAATNTLTITSAATTTLGQLRTAIANATNAVGDFTATDLSNTGDATVISGGSTGMGGGGTMSTLGLNIKANSLSAKDTTIAINVGSGITAGKETSVYDAVAHTLTVSVNAASTATQIANAITNNTVDTSGNKSTEWTATNMATKVSENLAYTTAGNPGTLSIQALDPGSQYANTKIQILSPAAGVLGAAYANNTLTITLDGTAANNTMTAIRNAVANATGAVGAFAAIDQSGTTGATVLTGLTGGGQMTTTSNDSGAAAFTTSQANFTTSADTVSVQALNAGSNFNNMQVKFQTVDSLSGALASYDSTNNVFTIQVQNAKTAADAVTLHQISNAISAVNGFAGSFFTKNSTVSGAPQGSSVVFGGTADTTAIGNTGVSGGNTLQGDLTMQVSGSSGSQVFTFKAGTADAKQVTAAINAVSDATGVQAYQNNGAVDIKSVAYGSNAFVSVAVNSEGLTGTLKSSLSASRTNGNDANATINGIQASSSGNTLSINTSSLGMTFDMQANSNGNFNFQITGGGAQFQLGPDVVSNEQLRIGIQSMSTATLGGVHGKLYQLSQGNNADLTHNPDLAAKIVDDASTAVTTLRGRLGAISGLTMATNLNTLTDMKQNAQTSLSLIQDTDFASETANLTRAQILSQANMSVLSIANQQPQQVLSLLPRG